MFSSMWTASGRNTWAPNCPAAVHALLVDERGPGAYLWGFDTCLGDKTGAEASKGVPESSF